MAWLRTGRPWKVAEFRKLEDNQYIIIESNRSMYQDKRAHIQKLSEQTNHRKSLDNRSASPPGESPGSKSKIFFFGFLVLIGVFGIFAWPALSLLASIYASEDDYSHGFMVPLISGYAAYQIWGESERTAFPSSWMGIPFLMLGGILTISGYWYYIALLPPGLGVGFIFAVGLWLSLIGLSMSLGGASMLRIFSFPIAFMVFAIPLPKSVTLPLTLWLRDIVSSMSEFAIRSCGITVFREGNVLHLVNGALGVADACSGIRSFWILIAGASAISFVLRIGLVRAVLLCLFAIPVSVIMNTLRIVVTSLFVTKVGIEYASGWRHDLWGWVTFFGGVLCLIGLAFMFSRSHTIEGQIAAKNRKLNSFSFNNFIIPKTAILLGVMGTLFGIGIFANYTIEHHYDTVDMKSFATRKPLSKLPDRIGGFEKITDAKILQEHLEYLGPLDHVARFYKTNDDQIVEIRVFYWSPLRFRRGRNWEGVGSHIPDICFPSWGFDRIREFEHELENDGAGLKNIQVRIFRKQNKEQCVLYWYKGKSGENLLPKGQLKKRASKLLRSWNEPILHHGAQFIVTIIVDVRTTRQAAKRTAVNFVREILPVLPEFGIAE